MPKNEEITPEGINLAGLEALMTQGFKNLNTTVGNAVGTLNDKIDDYIVRNDKAHDKLFSTREQMSGVKANIKNQWRVIMIIIAGMGSLTGLIFYFKG